MLVFAGEAFDTDNEHKRLKSLFIGKLMMKAACFVSAQNDVIGLLTLDAVLLSAQTSSEAPLYLQCVWPVWSMCCTSLPWMGRYSCAATGD